MAEYLPRGLLGEGLLLVHSFMVAGALSVEVGACGTADTFPRIRREGIDGEKEGPRRKRKGI